jgi:exodeoxyribonuclease VII small subunit
MASFEERLTALEAVVVRLERGELTLEDSVRLFEEGVHLSNSCKLELEKAEGRIQVLVETQGGGVQVAEMDLEDEDLDGDPNDEADDEDIEEEEDQA